MRKILLGLLAVLLVAFSIYLTIYGLELSDFEINSVPAIQEENANLDNKIQKASNLRTVQYPQKVSTLEGAYKKLMAEKESYEQLLALGVDENGQPINKIQEYEIEKIWVTMGIYAKQQGVDLKMDITSNNSISKTYDLKFTVTGGYIQITDFLYDIERDSTLVFKIENFKMVPGENTEKLSATFVCKDIKLNISETNNQGTSEENGANPNANVNPNADSKENNKTTDKENKRPEESASQNRETDIKE